MKGDMITMRDFIFPELVQKYTNYLLTGNKKEILAVYNKINEKLPALNLSQISQEHENFIEYWALSDCAKDFFERSKPYIEKLKEEKLCSGDIAMLGSYLASADSCVKILAKDPGIDSLL